jgi:protein-disulfide isomerase
MKQLLPLSVICLLAAGCNRTGAPAVAAASTPGSGAGDVAAKVGSRSLSNADLDARLKEDMEVLKSRAGAAEAQVKAQLADIERQVKEQEYNLRKKALTEMLFEMEAQEKKMSRNDLVAQEITNKAIAEPGDIDRLWEEVKDGARGSTKEAMKPQLEQMVVQRKTENQLARYQRELFKKYNVALIGLQPVRKEVKVPADAPVMGAKDAPVTIVEFTDYQCPYCQRAQQYVDRVMEAYKGKVRLVYQEFPLDFHPQAKPAGRAARCAGEQGKFWEMHTGLLRNPGALDEADLKGRAAKLGVDTKSFGECIASNKYDEVIQKSVENGRAIGVSGTPTFFLNGRSFSGAQPFEVFERMIEEELAYPETKSAKQ